MKTVEENTNDSDLIKLDLTKQRTSSKQVSEESATEQFYILCKYYGISFPKNPNERNAYQKLRTPLYDSIIESIKDGYLTILTEIDQSVSIRQYLTYSIGGTSDITYEKLTGAHARKTSEYELLGAMSKLGSAFFDSLVGPDVIRARYIAGFFLSIL